MMCYALPLAALVVALEWAQQTAWPQSQSVRDQLYVGGLRDGHGDIFYSLLLLLLPCCMQEWSEKKKQNQKVRSRQMRLQMALAFVQIGVWLAFRTCRATLFFCSNRNFRNWRNFLCVGLCSKPDLVEFRSLREALRCTTNCASNWHDDWTFRRMTSYMTERLLLTFDL